MMALLRLSCALVCIFFIQKGVADARETCAKEELPCDNGQCVVREDWCNGSNSCEDESDEAYCKKGSWFNSYPNKCKNLHFLCNDGRCVPKIAKCDGYADCKDRSDEKYCDTDGTEENYEDLSSSEETPETLISTVSSGASSDSYEFKGEDRITTSSEEDIINSQKTTTPTYSPTLMSTQEPTPWTLPAAVNYYAKRMEQENRNLRKHSPAPTERSHSVPSYTPPTYARRNFHPNPTRPHDTKRIPDPHRSPTFVSRSYDPRRIPDPHIIPQSISSAAYPDDFRRSVYPYQTQQPPSRVSNPQLAPNISSATRRQNGPYESPPTLIIRYSQTGSVMPHPYPKHYTGFFDGAGNFIIPNLQPSTTIIPPLTTERPPKGPKFPLQPLVVFKRQIKAPSRFYFAKNYTRVYGVENGPYIRKAKEWILSLRNSYGGWRANTSRALIALSLINNSFDNGDFENDLMQKYLQVFVGTNLLRSDPQTLNVNRFAMYINALLATCQNPRDFHGRDLTEIVRIRIVQLNRNGRKRYMVNPIVYLSLCLADRDLDQFEVHELMTILNTHSTPDEMSKDMLSLAITAFACHMQRQVLRGTPYYNSLETLMSNATNKLLQRFKNDGSFGSHYSTALAAQALFSINDTKNWNHELTISFLREHQLESGSFGDFMATYYILPVLSGRSLLHLRNTECNPPKVDRDLTPKEIVEHKGIKQHIRCSLYFGNPLEKAYSIQVLVPLGINLLDVMRVAEYLNHTFKFSYDDHNGKIDVYSISNVPNDYERGFQWHLYVKKNSDPEQNELYPDENYKGGIQDIYPTSEYHIIFWYHAISIR